MPWTPILMVCGMSVLVALLEKTKGLDLFTALLASISTLKSLDLYHTLVSDKGYERIKTSVPKCSIFWDKDSTLPSRRLHF